MKLDQAIKEAINEKDRGRRREKLLDVVNFMRYTKGWNYSQVLGVVNQCGVDTGYWEELMAELDDAY